MMHFLEVLGIWSIVALIDLSVAYMFIRIARDKTK